MSAQEFQLPLVFNVSAVFFFALTGALPARRLGYDIVGVFVLAFAAGLGGGVMRDSLLRDPGPVVALTESEYLGAVLLATLCGLHRYSTRIENFNRLVAVIDAVGLGAFAVVGTNKALRLELHWMAAVFVGVINAVGGSLLRDLLIRTEPLLLKPGQFYAMAALFGACVYAGLAAGLRVPVVPAAFAATIATVALRALSIFFDWRTRPIDRPRPLPPEPHA